MALTFSDPICKAGSFEQFTVYTPAVRPGFVAWASAFDYGDGTFGLSFDETVRENNPDFVPPELEYAESAGVPVSYCSVEGGSADQRSRRVYLRSKDGVTFTETGRCPREVGALCNVGFADGRIIGYNVSHRNEAGTGWSDFLQVRQSLDGGSTWSEVRRMFQGCSVYLWRTRRLRDGTIVLLASFYGTVWGPGQYRATRNTSLPYETYQSKIQTFFVTSRDGFSYSEPHYILPGIGAHEYDFVELADGRLLFIAGDVQGTAVGRQIIRPSRDGWINEPMLPILQGAPEDPRTNAQGGFVPETLVWDDKNNVIFGYRRNKGFSVSNDLGANWTKLEPGVPFSFLYQPFMLRLPDGSIGMYGHIGGDIAFGTADMTIQGQRITLDGLEKLPGAPALTLERVLSEDGSHYLNEFSACLTFRGRPVAGETVEFRFNTFWNPDGTVNTAAQDDAPLKKREVTDGSGVARVRADAYDGKGDIHLAYNVDVICPGSQTLLPGAGPMMTVLALTPYRRCLYPRDAYFAGGCLYLAPGFMEDFPGILDALLSVVGDSGILPSGTIPQAAQQRLLAAGVLKEREGRLRWLLSVHAPRPLDNVRPMLTGDWYE